MERKRKRKDTDTEEGNIHIASDDQYEMTEASTPLYEACEKMVKTRQRVMKAKDDLDQVEGEVVEAMKAARKSEINHKGDIIVLVKGKTIEDHIRFKKA